ncbi:MAG TPA: alpha/beta hydrolase, partial [Sphingomonas sp.]|uniref:RBBP9/YdeN family alpha/beta hydrolase n=1 Tax=Sphingomonas sp. TaxID=28214 RepID=UPI002EDABEE4
DADRQDAQAELTAFAPTPRVPLPFPSIVVASSDDPWVSIERAHSMAADWGSHFVEAGPQGHLNAASGIGWWREGQDLLERVIAASSDAKGRARSPGDARSVLAINATDAAHAHYLGG